MGRIVPDIEGPRTELYALTKQQLDVIARPLEERLRAWRFFNVNGVKTTRLDGRSVAIQGVKFWGSPEDVYWNGFFEPFIVAAATELLQWVDRECRDRHLAPAAYVDEARLLANLLAKKTYREMASIDQVLRGNGHPQSMQPRNVVGKEAAMCEHIDDVAKAVTHRGAMPVAKPVSDEKVLKLEPNLYGIGIDLRALWRRVFGPRSG